MSAERVSVDCEELHRHAGCSRQIQRPSATGALELQAAHAYPYRNIQPVVTASLRKRGIIISG